MSTEYVTINSEKMVINTDSHAILNCLVQP
jgi:hypothetical protein